MPVPFLEWAASHSNRDVLVAVAQNPNTPGDTLGKLARAKDPTVRQSVAQNPNTPGDVLDWLREDLGISGVRPYEALGFMRRIMVTGGW